MATSITLTREAQALLSGLIIMADWIASDTDKMPLIPIEEYNADSSVRALEAFDKLNLPSPADSWEGRTKRTTERFAAFKQSQYSR